MQSPFITIVSATQKEVEPLQQAFANNNAIHFLYTGIGCMATTFSLTHYLHQHQPNYLLQVGIAGSFGNVAIGNFVAVQKEFLADMGVEEHEEFKDIFDMQLANQNDFPFTNKALQNPYISKFELQNIQLQNAVTVNEVSTHKKRIEQVQKKYQAAIETMEGAAFHYVALQKNIPFLQLRGISNVVGERNKHHWNFTDSIANVNLVATNIIEALL
jgi:futalosine hydrolase